MNPSPAKSIVGTCVKSSILLTLVLVISSAHIASAQTTVTPDITAKVTPPSDSAKGPLASPAPNNPFIWGPVRLFPQISYRYSMTDGILTRPGHPVRTDIQTISPVIAASIGSHVTIRYAQTWNQYSSSQFRDTTDLAGSVYWNTKYDVWTLAANHTSSTTDSPMIETGQQTKQTTHNSSFNALYAMGSRYALETTLTQNLLSATGFQNPRVWSIREMLHNKITPQFDTAIGADYSYTVIKKLADMDALQLLASLTWNPTQQINMSLRAGMENRHIYTHPPANVQNPVFSAAIQLVPVATTQVGVTATRSTSASFLNGQLTESTQYGVNFQQRLLKRLQLYSAFTHQVVKYKSPTVPTATARKDSTDAATASLSTTFFSKLRTSLTYQYTKNSSSVPGFKFESNQISVEFGYSF